MKKNKRGTGQQRGSNGKAKKSQELKDTDLEKVSGGTIAPADMLSTYCPFTTSIMDDDFNYHTTSAFIS